MSRARASALVLVNWRGVFYERYLLDRHVTSLEGANGAGKTTVMIAAYVVLMPDLSRLRFTNLGESAATGGDRGIWGRLGEPGRPAYAALELELRENERVVLGVELERKAEPSVESKPFLITGLAPGVRLQELFLIQKELEEAVPELRELKENAEKLGAQVELFRSTREYFDALFERGITALRLASEEERGKLNEMLRTSMTGGISRALSSELRTFLFQKETGLSDALSRMRANLDTCRRSRTEVLEAQRLEREMSALVDAAEAWLGGAFAAASRELVELGLGLSKLSFERELKAESVQSLEHAHGAAETRERAAKEALALVNQEREAAQAALERARLVRECRGRIAELEERARSISENVERARELRDAAERARAGARRLRSEAQDALGRAAAGLLKLQVGLEELERRAHAHRMLEERLALARSLLGETLEPEHAEARAEEVRARLAALDAERARRARELQGAALDRGDFDRAFAALRELCPDVTEESALERARLELAKGFELEASARGLGELERARLELEKREVRRDALKTQAAALGLELPKTDALVALEAAWNDAEAELAESARGLSLLEGTLRDGRERERGLEARRRALEPRVLAAEERARRLEELGERLGTRIELADAELLVRRLERELTSARETAFARRLERERALEQAVRLEAVEGSASPELVRLAVELDAELAAQRFEDLEPEAARTLEAGLGPLVDAIVVLEPEAAARTLAGTTREIPEVRLISPDALREKIEAKAPLAESREEDVVVVDDGAVRVARKPAISRLGRRGRAAHAAALRERARELELELENEGRTIDGLAGLLRELERLAREGAAAAEGDPQSELAQVEAELSELRLTLTAARDGLGAARERERLARERSAGLRALVAKSAGLAEPANERSLEELQRRLEQARLASAELARTERSRRVLTQLLDALRHVPLAPAELAHREQELQELGVERDRWFLALSTLEYLAEHRAAIAFRSAEVALAAETALASSLEAEHERSKTALADAERVLEAADRDWEIKTRELQQAEAEQLASTAWLTKEREELARLGSPHALEEEVLTAKLSELLQRTQALTQDERSAAREAVVLAERLSREREALRALDEEAERLTARLRPLETRLAELRSAAPRGLSSRWRTNEDAEEGGRKSSELWAEARSKRELLLERLGRLRGASELAAELGSSDKERDPGLLRALEAALEGFSCVRAWLEAQLPQHSGADRDGLAAVSSLRQHLKGLEERLARHEHDLRFASEDLARGIEVRLRRAQAQVKRLNQHLTGIRFGSIHGIRIRSARVERMDQVLRALREGATQELLFQADLPIEEALNEIFRRHGGGKNGAERLLDYREYLELAVEITREEGGSFESANPTRLSTGEAIGVGAALMMVVLTEWERDANLLRGKRPQGSLRFLFLDEANRLSQDNLGVLFDLCQSLDLQLLIAAPEVARAEGNTTYRLVRQRSADGNEQVIVSGRRGLAN